jgi:hypothetical protein
MADTGNPWFIPFAEPSDLVRDWPALSSAVGTAVAAGLTAAGYVKDVKSAVSNAPQTDSLSAGASAAVTGLEIVHSVSDAANRVVLLSYVSGSSRSGSEAMFGMSVTANGSLVHSPSSPGSRTIAMAMSSGPNFGTNQGNATMSVLGLYVPGVTSAITYRTQVTNMRSVTDSVFINRTKADVDDQNHGRSVSVLLLFEVAV